MSKKITIRKIGKNKVYHRMSIWNYQNHAKMMEVNVNLSPEELNDLKQDIDALTIKKDYYKEIFLNNNFFRFDFGNHFLISVSRDKFIIKFYEKNFENLKINDRVKFRRQFNKMMEALEHIDDMLNDSLKIKKDPGTDVSRIISGCKITDNARNGDYDDDSSFLARMCPGDCDKCSHYYEKKEVKD